MRLLFNNVEQQPHHVDEFMILSLYLPQEKFIFPIFSPGTAERRSQWPPVGREPASDPPSVAEFFHARASSGRPQEHGFLLRRVPESPTFQSLSRNHGKPPRYAVVREACGGRLFCKVVGFLAQHARGMEV